MPWRERKSPRGKPKIIYTAGYACPRPDCDYFGNAAGSADPRLYTPRTPAMAAGLTDHIWSAQELLAFPVGP